MTDPLSAPATKPTRGRPRSSSRELLEDAAFELFLENTYAKTTVDQITQRAGVGRSTFFNYFQGKSDVFWIDVDASIPLLSACLADQAPDAPLMPSLNAALAAVASHFGPSRVPWILTQHELVGTVGEVQASALARFTQVAGILSTFAAVRLGVDPETLMPRTIAYSFTGALVAAAQEWASAGSLRGSLEPYVARAVAPLARGFATPAHP
ncbi:TetR/AcrR family transcriptional regulator [Subtercola frigoramans]|uniref:AcrR family transcriptional regulator n=1 Tax=Subtercola frigoramans TaxID=120298 RepID=A0ABS2L6K7_9MICO|nr:TetR family transcriptional regulator [Subtercola frigoramans]MBM7472735.1 AcrR family transcriptional regulator [Subtercola frigoramans]